MQKLKKQAVGAALALSLVFSVAACSSDAQSGQSGSAQSAAQSGTGLSTEIPEVDRSGSGNFPEVTFDDNNVPTIKPGSGEAPNQVMVKVLKKGDGRELGESDAVLTDYVGARWDGTVFDSSFERQQAAAFSLTGVVPGWHYGLAGTHVGDTVEIIIPPQFGYGNQAMGDQLPANSTLVFVVNVKDALDPADTSALKDATATGAKLPDGITVTGDPGVQPTLAFSGNSTFDSTTTVDITTGKGKEVGPNDYVLTHVVMGQYLQPDSIQSTWGQGDAQLTSPGVPELVGKKVGSRELIVYPGQAAQSGVAASGPMVVVVDIAGVLSAQ